MAKVECRREASMLYKQTARSNLAYVVANLAAAQLTCWVRCVRCAVLGEHNSFGWTVLETENFARSDSAQPRSLRPFRCAHQVHYRVPTTDKQERMQRASGALSQTFSNFSRFIRAVAGALPQASAPHQCLRCHTIHLTAAAAHRSGVDASFS